MLKGLCMCKAVKALKNTYWITVGHTGGKERVALV